MTELNISADDYNFVTMAYYVCLEAQIVMTITDLLSDPVYLGRDPFKPFGKATQTISLASENHGWSLPLIASSLKLIMAIDIMGHSSRLSRRSKKCRRFVHGPRFSWSLRGRTLAWYASAVMLLVPPR